MVFVYADVSCANDLSVFAILALLPESSELTFKGDGIILLFNAADPIPVTSWSVTKVLFVSKPNISL